MIPPSEERKQQIIDEKAQRLCLVLREEYPQDEATSGDLLCDEPDTRSAA